ncbi:MAG: DUF309 domain-containing protein [Bdellovibrionales bacterium]|nr:DUF309 domain-containing protein [Bdellovibrionales bacterium]
MSAHPGLQQGIEHFEAGRPWEAHEGWERAWRALPDGPGRRGLQGWIQLCAVWVHLQQGRPSPAQRQARAALAKLEGLSEGQITLWIQGGTEWLSKVERSLNEPSPNLSALLPQSGDLQVHPLK